MGAGRLDSQNKEGTRGLWTVSVIASILFLGLFGGLAEAYAETFHAKFSGDWDSGATWRDDSGAGDPGVPGPGDTAVILPGVTVTIQTDLVNSGRIDNSGTLRINAKLTNNGIFIPPGDTRGVINSGTGIIIITSTGEVENNGLFDNLFGAKMTIFPSGKFFNNFAGGNAAFHNEKAEVILFGNFVNTGDVHQLDKGFFRVYDTGKLTNTGNNAIWDNRAGSLLDNGGTDTFNGGTDTFIGGSVTNDLAGTINNAGNIVNGRSGTFNNSGDEFFNSGFINNKPGGIITNDKAGAFNNKPGGIINNDSTAKINNYADDFTSGKDGVITNLGVINNRLGGIILNESDIKNKPGSFIHNFGKFFNIDGEGVLSNEGGTINNEPGALIENDEGLLINISDGTINNKAGGTIKNDNDGQINNKFGTINNFGTIINSKGSGAFPFPSVFFNFEKGKIFNKSGGVIDNFSKIFNVGEITNEANGLIFNNDKALIENINSGIIDNKSGGEITNNFGGTIVNELKVGTKSPEIKNSGKIENSGIINNGPGGIIDNDFGGIITNEPLATIDNKNVINNLGVIENCGIYIGPPPSGKPLADCVDIDPPEIEVDSADTHTIDPTHSQVAFNEPVDGTFDPDNWTASGCGAATDITPSGPQTGVTSIILEHCDLADPAATPDVTYDATTGDLQDQATPPNVMETQTITVPDGIAPSLVGGCTISSDNIFDNLLATLGDTITVECTANESLSVPPPSDVQILNRDADSVNVSGPTLTATQIVLPGDPMGDVELDILFSDLSGNPGPPITPADLAGPNVVIDTNGLAVDTLTIESDNPNDNKLARTGDTLNIIFIANENIMMAVPGDVLVFGNPANLVGTTPSGFTAEYTLLGPESDGQVPIMINFDDGAGNNAMVTQDAITGGGNVIVDNTIPTFVNGAFVGGNFAIVNFMEPVNAIPANFINLDVNFPGPPDLRNINSISGSGTTGILLNFDGPPIPLGAVGIIDIDNGVTDLVGNPFPPLPGAPIDAGSMTIILDSSSTTFPLSDDSFIENIDATSVPSPELLLDGLSGGPGTATFPPHPITIETDLGIVTFPPGVTATGLPPDEILGFSISTKSATGIPGDPGFIFEVGNPNVDIFFDAPLRIQLPDKAGGVPFFINAAGITTEIITICPADDLPPVTSLIIPGPPNECSLDVGNDKVIYPNHLTGFGAGGGGSVGLSSGGGSSGDRTAPRLDTVSIFGAQSLQEDGTLGFGGILQKEIKLTNSMPTAIVETGTDITFRVLLYEKGGKDALSHITLYTDVHKSNSKISDSDTYLRYDNGEVTLRDPNGIFSKGDISFVQRGSSLEVVFELTAEKTMDLSDIYIRAWDNKRNSVDAKFVAAIEIVPGTQQTIDIESDTQETIEFGGILSQQDDSEPVLDMQMIKNWGGFSNNAVSDYEILSHLEIEGYSVPSWMMDSKIAKWVLDGKVTQQELVDALKYLEKLGVFSPAIVVPIET